MFWLGAAVLVAILLYLALRWFTTASAGELAQAVRTFIAVFSALASTGLIFAGRFGLAVVTVAATVMAIRSLLASRRGADPLSPDEPEAGIETPYLAMRLDRRTGRTDGEVRQGPLRGSRLSQLGLSALRGLLAEVRAEDPAAVDLLEAYLDRQHPDWRQAEAARAATGLDEATALQILGLPPGATAAEIKAAHRRLMAHLHPDHGGSTYLASQLNQAKELLLGKGERAG